MRNRTTPRVLVAALVALAALVVVVGLATSSVVRGDAPRRVLVVDDGSARTATGAVRDRLADDHEVEVVPLEEAGGSFGDGVRPDVVVVGLDAVGAARGPAWPPAGCVVGVVPLGTGDAAATGAGVATPRSVGTVPVGVTVVVDPGPTVRSEPGRLLAPDGTTLSDAGAQRYAALVHEGVRACHEAPEALAITTTDDPRAGSVRLAWPDAELRRAVGGPTPETGTGALTYEVGVVHDGSPRGLPRGSDGPSVELPAELLRFPSKTSVEVRVVAARPDGSLRVATGASLEIAPFDPRSLDVGPRLSWTATTPTVVVGDGERRAEGLGTWVDGTIGFVEVDGDTRAFAANGDVTARWSVGPDRFLGEVLDPGSPIQGLGADVHYAAGGPVHRDGASGALLLFYHGERLPAGDASRYWSYVGLAVSRDDGTTFRDLGPIVTPSVPFGDPAFDGPIEVGGAPFVIRDGHFLVYLRDVVAEADHHTGLNLAVARAPVDDVVRAALSGGQATWTKYGELGWDQPGLGGRPAEVLPGAPHPNWFDVAHLADHDLYVLVASHGGYLDWTLWVATSRDGIHWRRPEAFWKDTPGTEALYVSISSPDTTSQRVVDGDRLHVYRTRSTVADGLGHRWDGEVTIERMDLWFEPVGP